MAGDRSDLIPKALIPFSRIPQLWNPKSGLVFNSNNTPFRASDPADDLKPEAYSKTLGVQANMTNRAWRVLETYGADPSITEAEFDAYKYDLAYSAQSDMAKSVAAIAALDVGNDAGLAAAKALVAGWDRRTDVDNRAAALSILTAVTLQGGTGPMAALKQSVAQLESFYGRIDPRWGEANRIRRGVLDMPVDGGPDIFRAIYGRPGLDGRLAALAGDTYVMFVSWDRAGRLSSRSVHQFGAATQDRASRHYADQTPLFVGMKTKPVLFTEAELAGHIRRDYRPGE